MSKAMSTVQCCSVASAAQPARFIRLESEPKFEQSYTGGYAVLGKKEGYQISGVLGNYFQLLLKEKFGQEFQKEFCVHFDSYSMRGRRLNMVVR